MKQRFITSIFIVLASVLAILSKLLPLSIGDYIFDIFILAIIMVASFEMSNMMEKNQKTVNKFLATMYCVVNYAVLLICFKRVSFSSIFLFEILALAIYWLVVLIVEYLMDREAPLRQHFEITGNTLLACIYPAFFFCLLINFNHADEFQAGIKNFSLIFIMMIFLITWLTDTFAYLVGCTVKGPKLAPKISPNKTISGAVGGLLGGIVGAMLIFWLANSVSVLNAVLAMFSLKWWHFLLIGLFASVCGQAGDLFESKLKRNAGIKDSGNIFPGHGGMLDRVDAMIFVSTFMYVVIFIILM